EWFKRCRHEIEREALATVFPLLRSKLPTAEALVAAAGMDVNSNRELACQRLAERAAIKGVACPGCGRFSTGYKYVRVGKVSEAGSQSHLVCCSCGQEFGPEDI